jgi:hypothetical protein
VISIVKPEKPKEELKAGNSNENNNCVLGRSPSIVRAMLGRKKSGIDEPPGPPSLARPNDVPPVFGDQV